MVFLPLAVRDLVCFVWCTEVGAIGVVFISGPFMPFALMRCRYWRAASDNGRRVDAGLALVFVGDGSIFLLLVVPWLFMAQYD